MVRLLRRGTILVAATALLTATITLVPDEHADAAPRLSASRTEGLDPVGETVRVQGTGFDETKGIYLALCVKAPKPTMAPAPCGGGGVLLDGSDGSSQWVSSNPPSYGVGLAIPYGPGGSFDLTIDVSTIIQAATATTPAIDCRVVTCGITTRADHLRSGDRSQDYFIPVTFAGPAPTSTTPPSTTRAPSNATARTPSTPSKKSPSAKASSGVGDAAGSSDGWGSDAAGPGSAAPEAGAVGNPDTPGQAGPAGEDTPVTIPSSLFGDAETVAGASDPDDGSGPGITVQGESVSADNGPKEVGTRSSRTREVALADGSSSSESSGGSTARVLTIAVLIAVVGATGGGFLRRRRLLTASAPGTGDSSQVTDT